MRKICGLRKSVLLNLFNIGFFLELGDHFVVFFHNPAGPLDGDAPGFNLGYKVSFFIQA